jgi:hypothetical protein
VAKKNPSLDRSVPHARGDMHPSGLLAEVDQLDDIGQSEFAEIAF